MEDNNLANSSVTAEQIHELASAAKDMAASFNVANKELNKTATYMSKIGAVADMTAKSVRDAGKIAKEARKAAKDAVKDANKAAKEARKAAKEARKAAKAESRNGSKRSGGGGGAAATEGLLNKLTRGKSGSLLSLSKFGPIFAVLGAIVTVANKLLDLGKELIKTYSQGQKALAALGQESANTDFILGNTAKGFAKLESKSNTLGNLFGSVGAYIKKGLMTALVTLAEFIGDLTGTTLSDTEHATAGINRRQTVASTQLNLIGQGLKYKTAGTAASNIEAAAVAYLQKAYNVSSDEARNLDEYKSTVESLASLVTSGGQYGMFNTRNVQGYGYANGVWQPGIQYTDAYMSTLRAQMLSDQLGIYQEGGASSLADWNNRMAKIQTLVGNIANSVYSFDHVEQISATNLEDLDATAQNLGTITEDTSKDEQRNSTAIAIDTNEHIDDTRNEVAEAANEVAYAIEYNTESANQNAEELANAAEAAAEIAAEAVNEAVSEQTTELTGAVREVGTIVDERADETISTLGGVIDAVNGIDVSPVVNVNVQNSTNRIQSNGSTVHHGSASASATASQTEVANSSKLDDKASSEQAAVDNLADKREALLEALNNLEAITRTVQSADDSSLFGLIGGLANKDYDKKYTDIYDSAKTVRNNIASYSSKDLDALAESINSSALKMLQAGKGFQLSSKLEGFAASLLVSLAGFGIINGAAKGISAAKGAGGAAAGGGAAADNIISFTGGLNAGNTQAWGFATGGIGTSPVTNATLFENGPEAVIPLTSELGKNFMAESLAKAAESSGTDSMVGTTNINNIHFDGPVFAQDNRQAREWAEYMGDYYTQQVLPRRGGTV